MPRACALSHSTVSITGRKLCQRHVKHALRCLQPIHRQLERELYHGHVIHVQWCAFNQPFDNWNVNSVADMSNMFRDAPSTNHRRWDVRSATQMSNMFSGATLNRPIDNWDVNVSLAWSRRSWHIRCVLDGAQEQNAWTAQHWQKAHGLRKNSNILATVQVGLWITPWALNVISMTPLPPAW